MREMKCNCCGRKKKLFESFAAIDSGTEQLNLCVECNDLFYKLRDEADEGNADKFEKTRRLLAERMSSDSSVAFQEWSKDFFAKQQAKFVQVDTLQVT